MKNERLDENWIGPLLSHHAQRRALDLHAFVIRVMAEVDASQGGLGESAARRPPVRSKPARRRLIPVLIATGSVLAVVIAGSSVSALVRWTARDNRDDRAVVVRSSSSPSPSATPSPNPSLVPGGSTPPEVSAPSPTTPTATVRTGTDTLPSSFRWRSGAPVISPRINAAGVTGLKDPTVVFYGGTWHVFVTTVSSAGYGLGYLSFSRWAEASSAPLHKLDSAPMGPGFRAAPQVFYFAPQKLWYLVYQTGNASYSTNPDINNPNGWSAPKDFYAGVPDLIGKELAGGFWVGMWVICDEKDCYLSSSDNRGHLFRSQTPKANFPDGMSQPVIAAKDPGQATSFAASRVYQVAGTGKYLLLSPSFGGNGHGYLRSWTSRRIAGPWSPLADTPTTPFAGEANITFSPSPWTSSIVQGALIRDGYDQRLIVSPCHLRLLYLGLDPRFQDHQAFQIGLLTQTNPTCP